MPYGHRVPSHQKLSQGLLKATGAVELGTRSLGTQSLGTQSPCPNKSGFILPRAMLFYYKKGFKEILLTKWSPPYLLTASLILFISFTRLLHFQCRFHQHPWGQITCYMNQMNYDRTHASLTGPNIVISLIWGL